MPEDATQATPPIEEKFKLSKQINRFIIPFSILLGSFILVVSNLYSTQILLLKLDRLERRLPGDPDAVEVVPIEVSKEAPVLGKPNAPVTVIEYADFQCPYCKEFQVKNFPSLKKKYIDTGKVRFIYQHYAFLGDESVYAAEASKCAADQSKFWEYHDKLFENQKAENAGDFTPEKLKSMASGVVPDTQKFTKCVDDRKYQNAVSDEVLNATHFGVDATPTVFINGKKYSGLTPLYKLEQAIEDSLTNK